MPVELSDEEWDAICAPIIITGNGYDDDGLVELGIAERKARRVMDAVNLRRTADQPGAKNSATD
jgi:hypothetical protein